ncbi:MAG: DUF1963 domain-containing protein [Anderseniella sp.]
MSDDDFPGVPSAHKEPLILARMKRDNENAWSSATSWLGGLPQIAPDQWPRSPNTNLPLHHLAQISLAALPEGPWTETLPRAGNLNFFAETDLQDDDIASKVIFTPEPSTYDHLSPPADCPPIFGADWFYYVFDAVTADDVARQFRRWPIEFLMEESGLGSKPSSVHLFSHTRIEDVDIGQFPWDAARRLVVDAEYVLSIHEKKRQYVPSTWNRDTEEEHDKKWSKANKQIAGLRTFISDWRPLVEANDTWQPLGTENADLLEQATKEFVPIDVCRLRHGSGTTPLRAAASDSFRDMLVGPRSLYDQIPVYIREYLENDRRRTGWSPRTHHQVFGIGEGIHGHGDYVSDAILLQVVSDDMMSWLWGDAGYIQFWIRRNELAKGNWGAATALFQGH